MQYGKTYKNFLRVLIILGVLLAVLLPIWPDDLKSSILYFNVGVLYVMFGIMFLRVILYFVVRILGYEFWLFPNYLEDVYNKSKCGFFESFKPFISFEKCNDGWDGIVSRILGLGMLSYVLYLIYEDP